MKKLIVLLLAFVLAGAAFAQTPTVSGSGTLSWGVDLDSGNTGFTNAYSAKVTVPFAVANQKKAGENGWWGEIELKNITFKLTDDPVAAPGAAVGFTDWTDADGDGVYDAGEGASIAAKITNGAWAVAVYNRSSLNFNKAEALLDGDVDNSALFNANNAGTKISYAGTGYSAALIVNSKDDWTPAVGNENEYGVGFQASYTVNENVAVNAGVAYDMLDDTKDFGAYVTVPVTFGALSVTPAADFQYVAATKKFLMDAIAPVTYNLTEDKAAYVGFTSYYSLGDKDAEFSVSFDEELAGGFVNNLEAGAAFGYYNALSAPTTWDITAYAGYQYDIDKTSNVYARGDYGTDNTMSAAAQSLTAEVTYTNTAIANTKLTLTYTSGDLLDKVLGTLVAAAKVSL